MYERFTAHSVARFSLPNKKDTIVKIYNCFSVHLFSLGYVVGAT